MRINTKSKIKTKVISLLTVTVLAMSLFVACGKSESETPLITDSTISVSEDGSESSNPTTPIISNGKL